jgi:ATP-binding cassette subfamily F protein uup
MNILDVSNFYKSYGIKKILQGVTFTIGENEKVGFIGQNGCGKTTLFRLIAKIDTPDEGQMAFKRGATVGYLPQEPILDPEATVATEVESALYETRRKLDRYHAIGERMAMASAEEMEKLLHEQEEIGHFIDHHNAWEVDHKIDEVLSRLGVPDKTAKIGLLSGGMKKRVALAKLVLESPDLLLLDEPTNHLDVATTAWLEEFLIYYPGAVMLITHDRYFLDRVAQRIIEVESGKIYSYMGGYSSYLLGRAERLSAEGFAQGRLVTLLRRESEWMSRGPQGRQTKQKARIDRFGEMQDQRKDHVDRNIGLHLQTNQRLGKIILELITVCKSWAGIPLMRDVSLTLSAGERIGIVGPNGTGKTTLLRMILGEEHPSSGKVIRGKNTKTAYFDQKRECLDPNVRVEDALGSGFFVEVAGERKHKSSYLGEFLFGHEDQKRYIHTLSGGEKARLILAKMMLEDANTLILDEPTNDLDIPTLQLLDDALVHFNGCVLMVTHDRFFLDKVATGILSFEGNGAVRYTLGNYEAYQERLKRETAEKKNAENVHASRAKIKSNPPAGNRNTVPLLSQKEQSELKEVERAIEKLEARKKELERFLDHPGPGVACDPHKIHAWSNEFAEIEKALQTNVSRWEILEGKKGT